MSHSSSSTYLSLDEFIQKRQMSDQFSLLKMRKKNREEIDEHELNQSIDQYMEQKGEVRGVEKELDDSIDEYMRLKGNVDDLDKTLVPSDDVDMENLETINEDDDDLGYKSFQTTEQKFGYRVRSQQWRMLPENLVDLPAGAQRLEFLPLDEKERYKYGKILGGKVQKRYRKNSNSSSFSRCSSKTSIGSNKSKVGTFVERGSFTYKFGDRNGDGQGEGVIGIERAIRNVKALPENWNSGSGGTTNKAHSGFNSAPQQPINVNINLGGIIDGITSLADTTKEPEKVVEPCDSQLKLSEAANRLLGLLKAKKQEEEQIRQMRLKEDLARLQGRAVIIERGRGKY